MWSSIALVGVATLVAATAHAQPADPPPDPAPVDPAVVDPAPRVLTAAEKLTVTARNVARDGRCDSVAMIGNQVRALDADYYVKVFVVDPVIAGCVASDARLLARGLPPAVTPRVRKDPSIAPKDPVTAFMTSVFVTAGGIGLIAGGAQLESGPTVIVGVIATFVGPTTGHIYAGHPWNAGLGLRLGSLAVGVVGVGLALRCIDGCSEHDRSYSDIGGAMFLVGAIGYGCGTLYEMALAASTAERYNREHGFDVHVTATPIAHGAGLGVVGRF